MKNSFKILFILVFAGIAQVVFSQTHANKKITTSIVKPGSLVFFVIGDWGKNGELDQEVVAKAMKKAAKFVKPQFIITTGDNFYCCGVASIDDPQWNNSFENVYKSDALQINWYPTLGNHDYMGSVQAEIDYSHRSRRWVMPSRYYTFEKKSDSNSPVQFLIMDTNPFLKIYQNKNGKYSDVDDQDKAEQLKWMDSVLVNSSTNSWKIVLGHHPIFSSEKEKLNKELQEDFNKILEKNKVQAYISGHDHNLQHLKSEANKINYFVSGGGAEGHNALVSTPETVFAKGISGFMMVVIHNDTMNTYFVNKRMKIVYTFSFKKN